MKRTLWLLACLIAASFAVRAQDRPRILVTNDDGYRSEGLAALVAFPEGSDTEAYFEGRITVTPLRFDWTDHDLVRELQSALPQP